MESQHKLGVKDIRKQGAPLMGNWFWNKDSMIANLKAFYGDSVNEGYTCAWKSTYAGYSIPEVQLGFLHPSFYLG